MMSNLDPTSLWPMSQPISNVYACYLEYHELVLLLED